MKTFLTAEVLLALLGLLSLISAPVSSAQASTPCGETVLPAPINDLLKAKFPQWRPKQTSDLGSDDQQTVQLIKAFKEENEMKPTTRMVCSILLACCTLLGQEPPAQMGLRSFLAPEYPPVARQARIQGDVRLSVTVGTDGRVVSVESSTGPHILAAHAKANVVRWSYTLIGQPMKLNVVYTFRLEKPETERAPAPTIELESPTHIIITSNLPRMVG
jgi:TonB family protein